MKIKKFYEEGRNPHFDANLLAKKFSNMFFNELDEFFKIRVEYIDDLNAFNYAICFNSLYKESIKQMEELNIFVGLIKDGWAFEINDFEDGNGWVVYTEFNLQHLAIIKYLEKIEMLEKTSKFNL